MNRLTRLTLLASLLTGVGCSEDGGANDSLGGPSGVLAGDAAASGNPGGGPGGILAGDAATSGNLGGGNPEAGNPGGGGTAGGGGGNQGNADAGTQGNRDGGMPGGGTPGGGTPGGGTSDGGAADGGGGSSSGITGYFTSGSWGGFAWTATFGSGNTISPANFQGLSDWPVCVKGTVKGDPMGANGAMVGWNLEQERANNPPIGTVTPSKMGISVNIKANSSAQLRLQIQAADGATNAAHRWCAEIGTGGSDVFVPYSSFNTECWPGGKGTAYDKSVPLAQVIVQVPSITTDVNFDFCINSITEVDGAGMAGGTGCDLNAATSGSPLSGTLASGNKFQRVASNTGSPVIYVQNNIFGNGGTYTIDYAGPSFTIKNFTGSAATNGAPMGYPSLFIGSAGGDGQATTGSNLAKKVSALTSIPTAWRWSGGGSEFNAAYDVWFAPGAGDQGRGSRSFLMVWFHKTGSVFAEGEGEQHSGGQATINGKSFNTYVSQQFEGRPIISYVATTKITEWSFDLNDFIKDAKRRTSVAQPTPVLNDNLYLTNVFAGFELWSGISNLKTDNFCIQVK